MEKQIKARIQHKIDTYAHWSLAKNFVPYKGELIIYTTDENGDENIGLKIGDGVKNVNDLDFLTLPSNGQAVAPGGPAVPQIQTDYNQNDDSQIDYIKNRPFYSIPPEHSFNFRGVKNFNSITWDGNISNNPCELLVTPAEFTGGMRFFKVAEQTLNFNDVLNGTLYITAPMDMGEDVKINYGYYALRITPDMILYQDTNFLISEYLVLANVAGTLTLDVGAEVPVSAEFKEPGIYFFYMDDDDDIGYCAELNGVFDIQSSPNVEIVPNDPLGPGTILAYDKVYDTFIEKDRLLNSSIGMHMINYDNENDNQCISIVVNQLMLNNMGNSIKLLEDGSWYLDMNGIPLLGSIKTPGIAINGIPIEEAGIYFLYVNTEIGDGNGIEMWLDHWISPETIFQIDPKFIPKESLVTQPNWEQTDPEKSDYIKNKPFSYQYVYGYNFNEVQNSETKVYFDETNYPNSYFGLVKDLVFDNGGYIKLESIYVSANGSNKYLSPAEIYSSSDNSTYSISASADNDFITGSTTLMVYIKEPSKVDLHVNGNYYYLKFPKKGIYYLCAEDFGFYLDDIGYYYYYNADSDYQADWSQTNSYHPGYIRNKPNFTTTSDINSYSSSPVSSSGVYYALGGRSSISTTSSVSSGSDSLVTSGGVYSALQNVKVTTDSSVSSSSTNPIQSKAIYTALGNRASLTFDTYPQSGSNNPITSDAVYDAIGGQSISKATSVISGSNSLITSGAVYTALGGSSISTTSNVQSNSSSLITSKGVYTALGNRTSLTFDDTPTTNSNNLITSGSVYTALQSVAATDADTVDGYHFRVSETPPVEGEVDDYTITFVI